MERKQKIEAIREACIQANPEIVELKFGCEVYRGAKEGQREFISGRFNDTIALTCISQFGDFLPIEVPTALIPQWKIIGRPIRLADVLVAILEHPEKKIREKKWSNLRKMLGYDEEGNHEYIHWNLRKDSLDDQSDATIDFLFELLKDSNK